MQKKRGTYLAAILVIVCLLSVNVMIGHAQVRELTLSAGSIGGSWFIVLTAFSERWSEEIPNIRTTVVPGGGRGNPVSVATGKSQLAMVYNTNLSDALAGREPYDRAYPELRAIANLNVNAVYHFLALPSLGVNTLDELAAKRYPLRLDAGPRGTGGELGVARILEAHGLGYEEIRRAGGSVSFSAYPDAVGRMRDGHLDAFFQNDTLGAPWVLDLLSTTEVKFLSISEEQADRLSEQYGYGKIVVPAGTYPGQDEPFVSVMEGFVLMGHEDLDEDLVYALTKSIWENRERFTRIHPLFNDMDPKLAAKNLGGPLHPGAERYYREMGWLE